MRALETKNQERNLIYLLELLKYFFKTGEKPPFKQFILEDTTFLSLIKNIYVAGIVYLTLKNYPEFGNTWLEKELKEYYGYYKKQDLYNNEVKKDIEIFAKEKNKEILLLRDICYKNKKSYISGTRFSSDVDIQIKKNNLFLLHNFLREKKYLLQNSDFNLIYKPHLYIDGFYEIIRTKEGTFHKKELIQGIKKNYRTFNYYKNSFLEIHIPSYNSKEINKTLFWKFSDKTPKKNIYVLKPEFDLITQANHFFLHLSYNDKQKNRLRTFLGFLERLIDLYYLLKENINWEKVINLSIENKTAHQTYYYLFLGKKYLNLKIPPSILKKLKEEISLSHKMGLYLLNDLSILKDRHTFNIGLYSLKFLDLKANKNKNQ